MKSRYYLKCKVKPQTQLPKDDPSITIPPNIQIFREKLLSTNGKRVYENF